MDRPDPAVDAALVDLAGAGSMADLERAVRCYQLHADQHRPPPDPIGRRGLRIRRGDDGTAMVEIVLETSEAEELAAGIQAFIDLATSRASVNGAVDKAVDKPVDESPRGDNPEAGRPPIEEATWPARRADAFMGLVRSGLAHAGDGHAVGADRYLVHLVQRAGRDAELIDGTPLDPRVAERIACDTSTVAHVVGDGGEPLYLGRRTRQWSTAQRRAITVRDGGTCRFPGCENRHVDIHHLQHWSAGGPTDIDNGALVCPRHHTLLHGGFTATGNANGVLTFRRPNSTILSTTRPTMGPAWLSRSLIAG